MGNGTRDTQSGISYRDVAELMQTTGKLHSGRVYCRIDLPVRSGSGVVLDVRAAFLRRDGSSGEWIDIAGVSGRWPSGQSSTLAGLLFRLVYELEAKLEAAEGEAERAARGQRRMF